MSQPEASSLKGKIFLALSKRLRDKLSYDETEEQRPIPSLKWIDKQAGQFRRPEMALPVPSPAILISFPSTNWKTIGKGHQQGEMRVRIEVGYQNYADAFDGSPNIEQAIKFFEFNEAVHQALQGWSTTQMTSLDRVLDEEDDDHGALIVTAFEYQTSIQDKSGSKEVGTQLADKEILPKFEIILRQTS